MTTDGPVLVMFNDLTEFYAIQPDIDIMIQRNIVVDIFVVRSYSEDMYFDTKNKILGLGYNVLEDIAASYKIVFEPFPLSKKVSAEFRIKYQYGLTASSLKPDIVYSPEWNTPYDAVACYSFIEESIFSVYTKSYLIRPLQFNDFKLQKKKKKTNLLILLTWGDDLAVKKLEKIKEQLGDEYNLIIKAHHAVQYRPDHKGVVSKLKEIADEYYDASANVNQLFGRADIVLSDNSSAVFTAIYLGIPTAIFSEASSDYHRLGNLKAGHFRLLIEPERIPYTSKVEEVKGIIGLALENVHHQNKLRKELYPFDVQRTLADVAEEYLRLSRKNDPYYIVRDLYLERRARTESEIAQQSEKLSVLSSKVESLENQLLSFLGIKRSARLFAGNIKRRIAKKVI